MISGEVHARHYATSKPLVIRWENGRVVSKEETSLAPDGDVWIAPGMFDVQVNGYGGIDFQRDDISTDDLLCAVRKLRRDGCTMFLLTLITDEWEKLVERLRRMKELRDANPELRAAIAGWHIEGPFLSEQPGFHGAHNPAFMCDPTAAHIRELRNVTGSDPLLLTVAPERAGTVDAIRLATSLGIKISLGHTNAPVEAIRAAVEAGATAFTHLGNGCPRELDRHDNILWRVFETPGLMVGLIPDRIHVSPAPFRLFHRVLDSIYYTTDAMSAAGAPPGRYTIAHLELEVGADQIVRQPGKTNFAGSALSPIDGVRRATEMLQRPWQEAWLRFSEQPAKLMGLSSGIDDGGPANFCILRFDATRQFTDVQTVFGY